MRCPQHATCPDCDHEVLGWISKTIAAALLALLCGLIAGHVITIFSRESWEQIILKGHAHWATRPDGSPEFQWNAPCGEKK